jgi:hypothetical protein
MGFMNSGYRGRKNEGICGMPDYAKINAWDVGVRIEPVTVPGPDTLRVYLTGGSHDAHGRTEVGQAVSTEAGPRWVPAGPAPVAPSFAGERPVIASIPVGSHLDEPEPAGYVCVVLAGRYPSGRSKFGIAHLTREGGGWTVTSHSDYWNSPMSQVQAVTAMLKLTGCTTRSFRDGYDTRSRELAGAIEIAEAADTTRTGAGLKYIRAWLNEKTR